MRRAFIVAAFCVFAAPAVVVPTTRACQYCRQGADPEAYRFMNEGRISGSFPVDAGLGAYADATAPAAPAVAPDAAALVTTAAALPVAPRRSVVVPVAPPAAALATAVAANPSTPRLGSAGMSGHWADLGLLGLLGLGGVFVWRTRRATAPTAV